MKKQSGFSVLEIIMAVVIVGLLGAVGWLFYSNVTKQSSSADDTTTTKSTAAKPAESTAPLKTYTSTYLKLSFDYPSGWTVKKNPNPSTPGEPGYNQNGDKMLVVAPSGYTLLFDELKPDGLGGVCLPIEVSDFKLFGKTKMDKETYVVGYNYDDIYNLYVSTKSTKQDVNDDSCHYGGLIMLAENSQEDTPNYVLFGNTVIGEEPKSTTKPNDTELQQAAAILRSLRKS